MRALLFVIALLTPDIALAANNVALSSAVFLEKTVADNSGHSRIVLEEPKAVTPGDQLVFILNYRNAGSAPAKDFIVTNPLPSAVAYQGRGDGAQVSIDGGRSWGTLPALKVREADGRWRNARPEDVTHVRWALKQTVAAGAQGKLSFRGIVR